MHNRIAYSVILYLLLRSLSAGDSQAPPTHTRARMLSQALKGAVGSSSCTSIALASSQHSTSLLESSSALCSLEPDAQLHLSVEDESLDSPKHSKEHETLQEEEDEEPFWLPGCHDHDQDPQPSPYASASAIDALCRSFVASHISSR